MSCFGNNMCCSVFIRMTSTDMLLKRIRVAMNHYALTYCIILFTWQFRPALHTSIAFPYLNSILNYMKFGSLLNNVIDIWNFLFRTWNIVKEYTTIYATIYREGHMVPCKIPGPNMNCVALASWTCQCF
jgi:hypothetical protein